MTFVKAAAAGTAMALLAAIAWVLFAVAWVAAMIAMQRSAGGSGGVGAVSVGLWPGPALSAIAGFALGFWWQVRRARRAMRASSRPTT